MDLSKIVDDKQVIEVTATGRTWKDEIVDFLFAQDGYEAPVKLVLEKTDPKHAPESFRKRKHCLDSQKTYMKDMYLGNKSVQFDGIAASYTDNGKSMKLVGVYNKDGNIHPFKEIK